VSEALGESLVFRTPVERDVAALALLRSANWGSSSYWHERIAGYMNGECHPRLALAPRTVIVAEAAGTIVGFIAGHLTRRFDCDGELEWIDVVAERRNAGVATVLLRRLAVWFRDQQARRVCVDVDAANVAARAFYRKHGAVDLQGNWLVWPDITLLTPEL